MSDDIREFLSRVLPWPGDDTPGYVNIHVQGTAQDGHKFWSGTPTRDIDKFLERVRWYLSWPTKPDIYMCLSRQARTKEPDAKGNIRAAKSAECAVALKSLWIDIDVGKKDAFQTLEHAAGAFSKFLDDTGLPPPTAIVLSGGGMQPHWISKKELTPEEWLPYAEGLKALVVKHKLAPDAGVITDGARVLRIPGTYNLKQATPRPVRLLSLKENDYDFKISLAVLPTLTPMGRGAASLPYDPSVFTRSNVPSWAKNEPVESLGQGIGRSELPPVNLREIADAGCGWLQEALATGGRDFSQGLWNLATLASTFAEDGHELAHTMAAGYPAYSYAETDLLWERKLAEKRDRGLGWPSCKAVQSEGCKSCGTCPHLANNKSPLHLARISAKGEENTSPVHAIPTYVPRRKSGPRLLTDAELPPGYKISNGVICRLEQKRGRDGTAPPPPEYHQLFECELYEPWPQYAPERGINFLFSEDLDVASTVGVRISKCFVPFSKFNITELIRTLHDQGVKPKPSRKKDVEEFFMSFQAKLHAAQAAASAKPFGWTRNAESKINGFAYGGKIFYDDGRMQPSGKLSAEMDKWYSPRGDISHWFKSCKLVTDMGRIGLEAIMAAGFASPLMAFTGEYSGMVSVYGDSGSGKTSAAKIALAIWGHPKLTKEGPTTTVRSVLNKMGQCVNLPLVWDEIQGEEEQERCYSMLFIATLGAEGGRLNRNIEQQSKGDWQTLSVVCSNPSFCDYAMKRNPSTKAAANRMLEWMEEKISRGDKGHVEGLDAGIEHAELDWNFGRVGEEYAKMIATNHEVIKALVKDNADYYYKKLLLEGDERYWGATCATLLTGATLANYLGTEFHIAELRDFLEGVILTNRRRGQEASAAGGGLENTENLLSQYLNMKRRETLRTKPGNIPGTIEVINGDFPMKGFPTLVHFKLSPDNLLEFNRPEFNRFLRSKEVNASVQAVWDGLQKHFGARSYRAMLGQKTQYKVGTDHLIGVPVKPNTALWTIMEAWSNPNDVGATAPVTGDTAA